MTATNRENDFVYVIIILRKHGVLCSFSVRSLVRASNNTFLTTSTNVTKPSVYTFVRQIGNYLCWAFPVFCDKLVGC